MDLSHFTMQETATLQVKHPITHEPLDATITLRTYDLPPAREKYQQMVEKMRELDPDDADYERQQSDIITDLLVACTESWENVTFEGEALECTPENVKMLYAHEGLKWLRGQVDRFIADDGNFITGPPKPKKSKQKAK